MTKRFYLHILIPIFFSCIFSSKLSAESIEEVVVEAERQSGIDVLDEAASLKSFDLEDLETNQIASFGDVANFVPGLTASPTGSQGLRFTIRGIGARDSQLGVETRVGLYIDDAFLGRAVGSFDLVDLENVIVEKGPTGFTGGRNAVGGSISLISAKPMFDEFLGRVSAGVGNYGSESVSGIFNIPITDNFSSRVGFAKSVRDGWVDNNGLGEDFWGYDRDSYRISFLWQANENIEVNYSYDLNEAENQPAFFQAIPDTNGGDLGPYTVGVFGFNFQTFSYEISEPVVEVPVGTDRLDTVNSNVFIENGITESSGHSLSIEWDWAQDHSFIFSGTYRKAETLNTFYFYPDLNQDQLPTRAFNEPFPNNPLATVNRQIPQSETFPEPTFPEYQRFCCVAPYAAFVDSPNPLAIRTLLNSPPGGDLALRDHEQFSIEFKQEGTLFDGQIDYIAGIYYFNERTGNGQQLPGVPYSDPDFVNLEVDHNLFWSDVIELISLMEFDDDIDPDFLATSFISLNNIDTDSYAAFTQWNYHPFWNDRLHITLGLRHTYEEKSLKRILLRAITFDSLDDRPINDENDWTSLDPELRVQYDVSNDGFVYLRYSEGFRPGNFNVLTRKVSDLGFEAEFIDSYEIGYKASLFDDALSIEFALFRNEMENGQSTIRNIFSPLQRSIINTDSQSEGIELNLQVVLSDELSLSFEYAYLRSNNERFVNPFYIDYEYAIEKEKNANAFSSSGANVDDVVLPLDPNLPGDAAIIDRLENACYGDLKGNPIPNIARLVDFEIGACTDRLTNFGAPINSLLVGLEYSKFFSWGELRANLSYSHKDSYFVGSTIDITDRDIVDLRITGEFEMGQGIGKVALWSQNILDNEYTINALDVSAIATDTALYGTPRTVGIDFGYEWQ
ncbi:MAG: TonB-dependent receptor plug domain-containing protein [Pseudomonadota bacterium]|nr:TonB-dependent receptor plug domain-containing protein [Pseudomonadota bacterium]